LRTLARRTACTVTKVARSKRGLSRSCAIFSTSKRRGPPRTIRKGTDKLKDSIAHSWTCCPL
ncbi:hypothetical protein T08_9635, partial [Trichinella sp. T8]